jgi:hypothetical protein
MSCVYTSPQNSKAECILRTINNMFHSLLFQASIPARYWVEVFHITTYLLNRLSTKVISMTSPYFTIHGVAPSYEHLRGSVVPTILISPPKPLTNWHTDPPDVFSSDASHTTKVTDVLISPSTTSSSPNTMFLMRQIFPSLLRPV